MHSSYDLSQTPQGLWPCCYFLIFFETNEGDPDLRIIFGGGKANSRLTEASFINLQQNWDSDDCAYLISLVQAYTGIVKMLQFPNYSMF
jgi:hypothetical protein